MSPAAHGQDTSALAAPLPKGDLATRPVFGEEDAEVPFDDILNALSKPRVPVEKPSVRKTLLRAQDVYQPPLFFPGRQPASTKKQSAVLDGGTGRSDVDSSGAEKKASVRSTRLPPTSAREGQRIAKLPGSRLGVQEFEVLGDEPISPRVSPRVAAANRVRVTDASSDVRRLALQKHIPTSARGACSVAAATDLHQNGAAAGAGGPPAVAGASGGNQRIDKLRPAELQLGAKQGFAPLSPEQRLQVHWTSPRGTPREMGWRRQHSPPMGDYFDHGTHILHPHHLKPWDEDRVSSPSRIWPSGPVASSTLYDEDRQGKPTWRSATPGEGHGELFGYSPKESVPERPGCLSTQGSRSRPTSANSTRRGQVSPRVSNGGRSGGKKGLALAAQAPSVSRPSSAGTCRMRRQRS